jgi:hypothetical protein
MPHADDCSYEPVMLLGMGKIRDGSSYNPIHPSFCLRNHGIPPAGPLPLHAGIKTFIIARMQRGETAACRLWPVIALLFFGCSGSITTVGDGGEDAGIRNDEVNDPVADEEPEAASSSWAKTYGGRGLDGGLRARQTSDGGYIAAGFTSSFADGGSVGWLLKLDAAGNVLWEAGVGSGVFNGFLADVVETAQGDFVAAGGIGDFEEDVRYAQLAKLDDSGGAMWHRAYEDPGGSWTTFRAIRPAQDGGFILAGSIETIAGGDLDDMWVLKVGGDGAVEWQKSYGTVGYYDEAEAIEPLPGGGYLLAGNTSSLNPGMSKAWVMRLDDEGGIVWQNSYSEGGTCSAAALIQAETGGYFIAGGALKEGEVRGTPWVMKLDEDGGKEWERIYLFDGYGFAESVSSVSAGGAVVAGRTDDADLWIVGLDGSGEIQWQKIFGAGGVDYATSAEETSDGGYIVTGSCGSYGAGSSDLWILKLEPGGDIGGDCPEGMQRDSGEPAGSFSSVPVATTAVMQGTACLAVEDSTALTATAAEVATQCSE